MKQRNSQKSLEHDMRIKGVIIPIIFAIIVAVAVIIITSPAFGLFPSGNHYDSLTTTAPTQTTEYIANEYVQG